ncbi:Dihydrodipicolinate synthase [Hypoxylon texense]
MILVFITLLLSALLQVAALPAGVADVGFHAWDALNGTAVNSNITANDSIYNKVWQYNDADTCFWSSRWISTVESECTEYCEADSYDWGYRYHRLRYHIKLTGNGQDPKTWCDNIIKRVQVNCQVRYPDFYNCNYGRSPELPVLRTWAFDGDTGKIVQKTGANIRFDFNPWWDPKDNEHECVKKAIREGTCDDTIFSNGLRCIPTLWKAPNGSPEFDETFVPPSPRCFYNAEVPEEAR